MKLSAIVLIREDRDILEKTLKSLGFCDEVLTFKNESITDFSLERNQAMKKAKGEWILFVDADEIITNELKEEVQSVIANEVKQSHNKIATSSRVPGTPRNDIAAYYLRRRDYFWGKELKWGEVKKARDLGIIRLMRKDSGRWVGKVHEVFETKERVGKLGGFINHYPHQTIGEFLSEINHYSTLRALELQKEGVKGNIFEVIFLPCVKFTYSYFLKLGFLDGAPGFVYAFMMSFHSFLVRSKLYQFTRLSFPQKRESRLDPRSSRG